MTQLWIDATAGVAGDMLLGALIDAGADRALIERALEAVAPGAIELRCEQVMRAGMRATHARILQIGPQSVERTWAAIRALLEAAELAPQTKQRAVAVFERLAQAEAHVHGTSVDAIHFHEVGGLDAIGDIVGVCEALRLLNIDRVCASWVALGNGRIHAAHGLMPVPAPAVAQLSLGWQVRALPGHYDAHLHEHLHAHAHAHPHSHDELRQHEHGHEHEHEHAHSVEEQPARSADTHDIGELATPTGMALIRALAEVCTDMPHGVPTVIGVGGGGKDMPGWANVVRAVLYQPVPSGQAQSTAAQGADADNGAASPTVLNEIAANLDDIDHRLLPGVMEALFDAGAVDVWTVPIQMKKGRPALTLCALADQAHTDAVASVFLSHTTTLGVRMTRVDRLVAERGWCELPLALPGSPTVSVKVGHRNGRILHAQVEWDSLLTYAQASGVGELEVHQQASAAIAQAGFLPGHRLTVRLRPRKNES